MTLPSPLLHGAPPPVRRSRIGGGSLVQSRAFKILVGTVTLVYPALKLLGPFRSYGRGLGTAVYRFESQDFGERETIRTSNEQYAGTFNDTIACLSDGCIRNVARHLARAFPDRTNRSAWCLEEEGSSREGLILVKVPKAASSTSAGVALRIAARHNCHALQWQHKPGTFYQTRLPESFLFTSVRDPDSRVLSYLFFMEVSIGGVDYSDEWMLDRLRHFRGRYGSIEDGQGGFTMQFASLEKIPKFSAWSPDAREVVQDPKGVEERVQTMVDGYDFILVVDRMDESLVAMALLLDIDVGDVLVTSSKVAGSYFYSPPKDECVPLTNSFVSPAVRAYLESGDWRAQNYGDYLLHAAANFSLDLTIERLGRDRFDAAFQRYRALKSKEKRDCASLAEFPCSATGERQLEKARNDCYVRDFGCGHRCIDEMIASADAWLPGSDDTQQTMEFSSLA